MKLELFEVIENHIVRVSQHMKRMILTMRQLTTAIPKYKHYPKSHSQQTNKESDAKTRDKILELRKDIQLKLKIQLISRRLQK